MGNPPVATASRTWTIIQTMQTRLGAITRENGYLTDVGLNVWTTDAQRPSEEVLGVMIYAESILGNGLDRQRAGKPIREFGLLLEAAIGTDLDDGQEQIHNLIEDLESFMEALSKQQTAHPDPMMTAFAVTDIAILDRPEGSDIIAMQMRVVSRYFR